MLIKLAKLAIIEMVNKVENKNVKICTQKRFCEKTQNFKVYNNYLNKKFVRALTENLYI